MVISGNEMEIGKMGRERLSDPPNDLPCRELQRGVSQASDL
jgi:hypothetical protein